MRILNSSDRFGIIAIILHWLMAILIVGLIILGLYMTRIPLNPFKLKLYGWHKEVGMLVLFLVVFRLCWRIMNTNPQLPIEMPLWEKISAHCVHWVFYFFMFALPLSGWLLTSSAGLPASFFGLFVLPDLISANEEQRFLFTQIHDWLGYILIGFICLHTLAALKHHFINKDDILQRMLL